jgi:hypothetical protein
MNHKRCEWCDHQFQTKINYQIYCSAECREAATKEKIAQNYILKRIQKRRIKGRACKSCGSHLSIYNDNEICSICNVNPIDVAKALKDIKRIMRNETE